MNTPAGSWYVKNTADGWMIENRFTAGEIEGCRLLCHKHTQTIEMEVYGFEQDIKPGERIVRKHTWEIKAE